VAAGVAACKSIARDATSRARFNGTVSLRVRVLKVLSIEMKRLGHPFALRRKADSLKKKPSTPSTNLIAGATQRDQRISLDWIPFKVAPSLSVYSRERVWKRKI